MTFKELEPNIDKFLLMFSGGKDSVATLLWVLNNVKDARDRLDILYVEIKGGDFPDMPDYLKYIEAKLNVKINVMSSDKSIADLIPDNGFPCFMNLWCHHKLKMPVIRKYLEDRGYINNNRVVTLIGVRHGESKRRSDRVQLKKGDDGMWHYLPIIEWSSLEVVKFIKSHGISLCLPYKIGDRMGCFCCPSATGKKAAKLRAFYPAEFKQMIEYINLAKNKNTVYKNFHKDMKRFFRKADPTPNYKMLPYIDEIDIEQTLRQVKSNA